MESIPVIFLFLIFNALLAILNYTKQNYKSAMFSCFVCGALFLAILQKIIELKPIN